MLGADSLLEPKVAGEWDPAPSPCSPSFPLPEELSVAKHWTGWGPSCLLWGACCWPLLGALCCSAHNPGLVPASCLAPCLAPLPDQD